MAKRLSRMTKEEIELLSYNDIAYLLLKEERKQTTLEVFTKIVGILELPKKTLENKIGEFYTALTKDRRFLMLEDGTWDLTSKHKTNNITVEDDIDDYDELEEYDDPTEEDDKKDTEDTYSDNDDADDANAVTEEYKNLVIVDEEDLEQN